MSKDLLCQLESVFPDTAFAQLGALSGQHYTERCDQAYVSEFFRNRPWHSVTLDSLRTQYRGDSSACLAFMTDEAFAYYLPAFVMICVLNMDEADVLPLSVISSIAEESEESKCRLLRFTPKQLGVLKSFVRYMSEELQNEFPGPKWLLVAADRALTAVLQEKCGENGGKGGGSE